MKNLTFLRVVLLTLCLTLLSTSVAWGDKCGAWLTDATAGNPYAYKYRVLCPMNIPAGGYVVNVQQPWGTKPGIYFNNMGTVSYCSLGTGNYSQNGGTGLLLHLDAFVNQYTEVTITSGGNNYTFTIEYRDGTPSAPEPPCDTKHFYFVNAAGWANPKAYMWKGGTNTGWPGVDITELATDVSSIIEGLVYEVSYEGNDYDHVIFSNNGSNQTADLTISNCSFYLNGTAYSTIEDVEDHFVFYVNTPGWTDANVKANIWKNGGAVLGSFELMHYTGTTTKEGNYKVFYYYNTNLGNYDRIQFHNNGANYSGTKTLELGHYFNYADDCWYTSIKSLNIDYSSSWHKIDFDWTNKTKTVMTAVASLPTGSTSYQFYLKGGGEEYYRNSGTMTNSNCTNWKMDGASNCWITADVPGDYIFKYDFAENKLSVVYPPYMTSANCSSSTTTTITLAVASTRGTKYHVVDATHGVDQIVTPAAGLITVTGLTPSTEYTFTVTAMDNNDTESVNNASSTCTTMDPPSSVPANREDLTECQVLSVIGTTKYTPMGIESCEPWGGPTRTRETIGSKGTNNVEHISGGTAAALHFATPSNVQTFSKIHLEVWTADAMTLRFGLLCWKNNAYNDMGGGVDYHPQSFTTNAAKWTTIEFTLTDLTTMEWLVNACHLYFYDLAGEDLYITNVYFYNEEKDCTECSREGGAGSGQSFAGATLFGTGYSYSIKWKAGSTGNPDSLIVSAEILDDITTGRILLFFHKTESGDEMYEEVEVAPAVDRTKVVTNKCIAIPPKVRDDDYAYLSVKFEKDGGGVYFTDRMFYDLKHGGCAEPSEAYFDIYHWDDAPVGARTSYNGGTIVTKIRYFRHFDTNWTTISVPFEVERVAVYDETDHVEYPLFPRFHNNSADVEGYYWLKTFPNWNTVPVPIRDFQATWQQLTVATDYDGWYGGNISGPEETWLAANVKPEKNTPYAIKFPYSGYYETNWVIFYGAAFQTIASDFTGGTSITLTDDNYDYDQVKLQCNNTMHPSSALTNIYMIEEGTDLFTRRESQAVPAFESYVIGTHEVQARYSVLRWSGSTPSTTDLDNRPTTADGAGKIYTVSGICVASFADSEQMENVLNTLNAGVYVVRVGSQINKVFIR